MVYKNNVVTSLRELADESTQRRLWLASEGPEISSFTEAVCQLFDDTGLGDDLEKRVPVFSPEVDTALSHLGSLLGRIEARNITTTALIESIPMQEVRRIAAAILQSIEQLT